MRDKERDIARINFSEPEFVIYKRIEFYNVMALLSLLIAFIKIHIVQQGSGHWTLYLF